jgi:predicted nucleic acid-binding protein
LTVIVDASVVVKAFLPEDGSDLAYRLLESGRPLHAPDLIRAEFGNALSRRHRLGQLEEAEMYAMAEDFAQLGIRTLPTEDVLHSAMTIAASYDRTVYDSLYLALAVRHDIPLVTADQKFVNAMRATPFQRHVVTLQIILS